MTELKAVLKDLRDGLAAQQQLVDKVASLQSSHRTQKVMTSILFALLLAGGYGVAVARDAAAEASDSAAAVERLVEAQDRIIKEQDLDQQEASYAACLTRNAASRSTREEFARAYDALELFVTDSPDGSNPIDELRKAITPIDQTDRDCNGDGQLTFEDYPAP